MKNFNISNIDLNLLTVFDAVMEDGNTTRAAARLGLTQPAVSHALKRLRTLMGDALFVRTPRGMTPTPTAREMAPGVRAALEQMEALFRRERGFSPGKSTRRFVVGLSDYASFAILPGLLDRLATEAPGVSLSVKNTSHGEGAAMLDGDDVELIVGNFPPMPPHLRRQTLFRDGFLIAGRSGHPGLARKMTMKKYLNLDHLQISTRGDPYGYVDAILDRKGLRRSVKVTVPHFLSAPFLLRRTDLIATEPRRLLEPMREMLSISLAKPPFAIPQFTVTQNWHSRYDGDAGHSWLRSVLESLYREKAVKV